MSLFEPKGEYEIKRHNKIQCTAKGVKPFAIAKDRVTSVCR